MCALHIWIDRFGLDSGVILLWAELLLLKIEKRFPVNNSSTISGIDLKLCACIPHMERKVGIGFGRDPNVGGATVAKNRKKVSGR